MADFWRGFGGGFAKSYESARERRARKEELEEQRKYQERIAEEKERRERDIPLESHIIQELQGL